MSKSINHVVVDDDLFRVISSISATTNVKSNPNGIDLRHVND